MLVPIPTDRVLAGIPATISITVLDQDGATNSSPGTVTVEVTKLNGTSVVAAGASATVVGGVASYTLTAAQVAALDYLKIKWTNGGQVVATSLVEIVGSYYASVQEIIESDRSLAENPQRFSPAKIVQVRNDAEDLFDSITGQSWTPRYRMDRIAGSGTAQLILPTRKVRKIRALSVYWTGTSYQALTQSELDLISESESGVITRTDGFVWLSSLWRSRWENILVEWEHGADYLPGDLHTAFLTWCRYRLNSGASGIPDRATGIVDAAGSTFRISTPGVGKNSWTGIPDVDAVLTRYRQIPVGIA